MAPRAVRLAIALATLLFAAGCVQPTAVVSTNAAAGLVLTDPEGAPIPYAAFAAMLGETVVLRGTTDLSGTLVLPPAGTFDRVLVAATGYEVRRFTAEEILASPSLAVSAEIPGADDPTPLLRVLAPYDFGTKTALVEGCDVPRNNCGLSEPSVEVDGAGTIYTSGVCCVGLSPPVFASRDGGATWAPLRTPGIREAVGIEGDFAVDDAGNLYFSDILAGALWMTSWDKDGEWRHTTPAVYGRVVDRPWIRAGAQDTVYFLFNALGTSEFRVSKDGGRTWAPLGRSFEEGLANLGQGPQRDDLWVEHGWNLSFSPDGGATWGTPEPIPRPKEPKDGSEPKKGTGYDQRRVPVVDEAGRVLVTYSFGNESIGYAIHGAIREPDGAWGEPFLISPAGGTHFQPWPAAGPDGGFVVAWYGTDDEAAEPDDVKAETVWRVHLAATHDAGRSWEVVVADPEPVAVGPMGRRLLDFLQVDLAPDGAAHVAYAKVATGERGERMHHVRTTVGLGLAPVLFPNGPRAPPSSSAPSPVASLLGLP